MLVLVRCHVLLCLIKFSGGVLRCFTISRETTATEVASIQPVDSPLALFEADVYSMSWVSILVKGMGIKTIRHSEHGAKVTSGLLQRIREPTIKEKNQ